MCGHDEFEGYIVFLFEQRGQAFLECPKVGNALYVMKADEWRFLSMESKSELMRLPAVRRIPHIGDGWKRKVRQMLTDSAARLRLLEQARLAPKP